MIFKHFVILLLFVFSILCGYKLERNHRFKRFKWFNRKDRFLKIETQNGLVQGHKLNNMYAFNGIPYAKPPIGQLRFEPPQEPNNWYGIWNATFDRNQCVQSRIGNTLSFFNPNGNEDCLYINVYIPQKPKKNHLLPVIVWIHGGAFIYGNSSYDLYGPDNFVRQNVIAVSFNYRLGIFGFLSTNDEAAPGNNGLRDQILALKWVQRNIEAFGGDPVDVTIFGQSAGAASVSHLVLSPLAKGLFKKAILASGSALCPWSLSKTAKEAAYKIGDKLNLKVSNSKDLVRQLKQIPPYDLQRVSMAVMGEILIQDTLNGLVYGPVIETPSDNSVVKDYGYETFDNGDFNQVPLIIGYTSAEALGFSTVIKLLESYLVAYDMMPARLVPSNMNANKKDLNSIGQEIKEFYAGPSGQLALPNSNFVNYLGDDQFVRPILKTAELTSMHVKTYLYRFSYTVNSDAAGAGHGDELGYIFNSDLNSTRDWKVKNCLAELWTNFVKYDNPTPTNAKTCGGVTWIPMEPNDRQEMYYLNIDTFTGPDLNPDMGTFNFWERLYKKYGNTSYETY